MELLAQIWDIFLHLDTYLNAWAGTMGPWLYVVLFAVVFLNVIDLHFHGAVSP